VGLPYADDVSKTIHDDAYGELLSWLKAERVRRNAETGGTCTMRALAPRLARLLGRPNIKFSWVAKIEQKDRRIDLLEYAAYCVALGVDPYEGLRRVVGHFEEKSGRVFYPRSSRRPAAHAAEPSPDLPAAKKTRK